MVKKPATNKMNDDYWMTETDYPITIIASIFQPFVEAYKQAPYSFTFWFCLDSLCKIVMIIMIIYQ